MRKLLDEDPEKNNQLLKESCKLIITLMKGIFSGLNLNNNNLEPCNTIEDNIDSGFFSGLKLDENWHDMKLLNHYLIWHYYQHILNIHVKSKSIFSVKKCGINNCSSYFAPQLPPDMFSTLYHLPDPETSEINEGHYKTFNKIYGTKTSEKFLPSNTITKRLHGIFFDSLKQHANNTQNNTQFL